MKELEKCPSCGNRKDGSRVYECLQCRKSFCQKCGYSTFGDVCPECDKAGRTIGKVVSK